MKALKTIAVVATTIGVVLFGYYLTKTKCAEPFHTTFLQKGIRFPISVVDATQKYNLRYDSVGVRGVSSVNTDTIMVVDAKRNSNESYCVLFYLRDMSNDSILMLKHQLEKQYNSAFIKTDSSPFFQYMKINDCVYLLIDQNCFYTTEDRIFKHLSKRRITCRLGFYYGLSENELISTSADGHIGIIGRGYEPSFFR